MLEKIGKPMAAAMLCKTSKKSKKGEPKLDSVRRLLGIYFIDPWGQGTQKKPSRMLARNWKHQRLQPCLARYARKNKHGETRGKPMRSNQTLRVSWNPVNPQDCVWKNLYRNVMRTMLQERATIHCNITIWYTNFLCLKPWRYPQQKQQWIKNIPLQ